MCGFLLIPPPDSRAAPLTIHGERERIGEPLTETLVEHGLSSNPLSTMPSAPCAAARWGLLFSERRFFSMRRLPIHVACWQRQGRTTQLRVVRTIEHFRSSK